MEQVKEKKVHSEKDIKKLTAATEPYERPYASFSGLLEMENSAKND